MGCCGGGGREEPKKADMQRAGTVQEDPMTILKMRLAKGEIAPEEYDRLAEILSR
jgi:uncharacterized membrane protein